VQQELVFFRALELISVFGGICVAQSLVFCVVLCRTIVCILSPSGNCCVCTLLATHCLLAYACCTLVLHRPLTTILHLVLFCTMRSRSCHLQPSIFISAIKSLLQVFLGLPFPCFPWGFHCRAYLWYMYIQTFYLQQWKISDKSRSRCMNTRYKVCLNFLTEKHNT